MLKYKLLFSVFLSLSCSISFGQTNYMIVDWGSGATGQLVEGFKGVDFTDLSTSYEHTLAITAAGEVVGWGANNYGQLTIPSGIVNPTKVIASLGHSVVLYDGGKVKIWGLNDFGQAPNTSAFTDIIDISAGDEHTLLLHSNGTVTTLGTGTSYNQVLTTGNSNIAKITSGNFHNLALKNDGTVVAWGSNEFGQSSVPATLPTTIDQISAGQFHSIALLNDGTVRAWGDNTLFNQIDVPTDVNTISEISVGNYHTLAIKDGNQLKAWGSSRFNETYIPTVLSGREIKFIAAGFAHNTLVVQNSAPTSISPTDVFIAENSTTPTTLAQLTATDPDAVDVHRFSFTTGTGSDDNNSFYIDASGDPSSLPDDMFWEFLEFPYYLKTDNSFDYETKSLYKVRVQVSDLGGLTFEQIINIHITNVNDSPMVLNLDNMEVLEHQPNGTKVGTFSTEDPDVGDTHTYSFAAGDGDKDNGLFSISGDELQVGTLLDAGTHIIRIRSTDSGGLWIERQFVIEVLPFNNPPTDITLSNDEINEDVALRTIVGFFSTTDLDPNDSHSYQLITAEDNAFTITSNALQTNIAFNYDTKNQYTITVKTTDNGTPTNESFTKNFTIKIIEVINPPVANNQTFEILEDAVNGSSVGTFSATSKNDLIFKIDSPDQTTFAIHPTTGEITVINQSNLDATARPLYELFIKVTDDTDANLNTIAKATILVKNVNTKPTDIHLNPNPAEIDEGLSIGTFIGNFSTDDDDAADAHSYQLISGVGDDDNNSFSINQNTLFSNTVFTYDASSDNKYSIKVKSTDSGTPNQSVERTFEITVLEVVQIPTANNQTFEIIETTSNDLVGTFVAESRNGHTFGISSATPDDTTFSIDSDGKITVNNTDDLNAIEKPLYQLTIKVIDALNTDLTTTAIAFIEVKDGNFAPKNIALTNNNIDEQLPAGTFIGTLSTTDPDITDTHSYSVDDVFNFRIDGNSLLSNRKFNYSQVNSYTINITTTDNLGASIKKPKAFTITVNEIALPIIPTAFTPNSDGVNDRWEIENLSSHPNSSVKVFDRSGQQVFSSRGYNSPWDGTFDGRELPVASYYFVINLSNESGTQFTGTVTLLR